MIMYKYRPLKFLISYALLAGFCGILVFVFGLYEELGLFKRISFNDQEGAFLRIKVVLFFLFAFFIAAEVLFVIPVISLAIFIIVLKVDKSIFSSLFFGTLGGGGLTLWAKYVLAILNLNSIVIFFVGSLVLSLGTYIFYPFLSRSPSS